MYKLKMFCFYDVIDDNNIIKSDIKTVIVQKNI